MSKWIEEQEVSYVTIGTAGHVDHGKTALVKALTGMDTDRLPEEKERGMTTDLGYASFVLGEGTRIQLIDVPGHEKFIRNMLAGVGGLDLVLLVVDLTEGVKRQTREHLQILNLLGICQGILVLTKSDLLEETAAKRSAIQIQKELKGTFLEQAPTVLVSSLTGSGIGELKEELRKLLPVSRDKCLEEALPRMWVSRVFLQKGAGLVAAGTLQAGCLRPGDCLACYSGYPKPATALVREIQVQGETRESAKAGQRCALNLPGLARKEGKRGTLLTYENSFEPTSKIEAWITILPDSLRVIQNRTRLHFFIGTRRLLCRIKLPAGEQIGPGEQKRAVILLEEELILCQDDRFILRFYSPEETIGGGSVLEVHPDFKRHLLAGRADGVWRADQFARYLGVKESQISAKSILILRHHSKSFCLSVKTMQLYQERAQEHLKRYREEHPYGCGITREQLILVLWGDESRPNSLEPLFWEAAIQWMIQEGNIHKIDGRFSDQPYSEIPRNSQFLKIHAKIIQQLTAAGYHFIEETKWVLREDQRRNLADVVKILEKDGQILCLKTDVYTMPELVKEALKLVEEAGLCREQIKTSQLKALLQISRKQADILRMYWKDR